MDLTHNRGIMSENKIPFVEYLRLATPFLLLVLTSLSFMVNTRMEKIECKLESIDDKMFKHLTNDEIHTPKSIAFTKAEFMIYSTAIDKQMTDTREMLENRIISIKSSIDKVIDLLDYDRKDRMR